MSELQQQTQSTEKKNAQQQKKGNQQQFKETGNKFVDKINKQIKNKSKKIQQAKELQQKIKNKEIDANDEQKDKVHKIKAVEQEINDLKEVIKMYQECYPDDAAFLTKKEKKAAEQEKQNQEQENFHNIQKDTLMAVADALVAATVTHHLKQSISGADESAVSQLGDLMQATLRLTNQNGGAYSWEQQRDLWTAQMVKVVQKKDFVEHVAHIHTQLQATYGAEELIEEVILDSYQSTIVAKQSITEEVIVTETQQEEKQDDVQQIEQNQENQDQETQEHQEEQKETQETEEKKGDDQLETQDQDEKKKDNRPHTAGRRRPDTAVNRGRGRARGANHPRNQDDDGFTKVGQEHRGGRGGRGNRGQRGQRGQFRGGNRGDGERGRGGRGGRGRGRGGQQNQDSTQTEEVTVVTQETTVVTETKE